MDKNHSSHLNGHAASRYRLLTPGDPAPLFKQRTATNPDYTFGTIAGRYVVLCFPVKADDEHARDALAAIRNRPRLFDDVKASSFIVSVDPEDEAQGRLADHYPGLRIFWDFDLSISRLYGSAPVDADAPLRLNRFWLILDPMLRTIRHIPFQPDRSDIATVMDMVAGLPPLSEFAGIEIPAPILILPNVLEPSLCDQLVDLYREGQPRESGFMREVDGLTREMTDAKHKRRRDIMLSDETLLATLRQRFKQKVVPEIQKAHQFAVTRMERFLVGCYTDEDGGHFAPHRDNTTKGTAHRRFAASVNLNEDFEGGLLRFPEFGPRTYRPPKGAALIFSCSLLHMVTPVTRGRRFAFLPFFYDEAAAKLRETNNPFLHADVGAYKA